MLLWRFCALGGAVVKMSRLAKFIATVGGLGYCPLAPGTVGSVVGLAFGLAAARACSPVANFLCAVAACVVAIWASDRVARDTGYADPSFVIIDETAAMWLVVAGLPPLAPWWLVLVGFVAFRVFDIWKAPPLRRVEQLPGGWGIVLDDVGAAAYTLLTVQGVMWLVQFVWS